MDASNAVVVTARLPKELGDWVNEEFPRGFKQQFMHQCFHNLRHVLTRGELPPQSEYARAASIQSIERMAGHATAPNEEHRINGSGDSPDEVEGGTSRREANGEPTSR